MSSNEAGTSKEKLKLGNNTPRCAEGRVGIRRSDVAGRSEDFADVFREIVAVGEPRAVLLDRKRTRRNRLRRIPSDEPERRMRRTRQIERRNLQVAAIDIAVVQRRYSRNRHFLFETAALRVVNVKIGFYRSEEI